MLEYGKVNYAISSRIHEQPGGGVYESHFLAKAVKNPVEMERAMRKAHIKDGVAMTRFIYWLKHNVGAEEMDEMSVAGRLGSSHGAGRVPGAEL